MDRAERDEKRIVFFRGKYAMYWRENGKPYRVSLRTDNLELAKQRFRDTLAISEKPSETVYDCFQIYLKEKPQEAKTWKALQSFWQGYRPHEITKQACREYASTRQVKNGTIHRELTILRAAINSVMPNNQAEFAFPKKPPPKEHYLTKDEFKAIYEAAKAHHVKVYLMLAISTAGRNSALLELTWDRVDFNRGTIRLSTGNEGQTKGRATVPMTDSLRTLLEEAYNGRLTDYVVEYAGSNVKSVKRAIENIRERTGIKFTPHVLRHSAAVWMAESGVSMSEIAQYLGHTNTNITYRVYARYSPEHLKDAAKALDVFN